MSFAVTLSIREAMELRGQLRSQTRTRDGVWRRGGTVARRSVVTTEEASAARDWPPGPFKFVPGIYFALCAGVAAATCCTDEEITSWKSDERISTEPCGENQEDHAAGEQGPGGGLGSGDDLEGGAVEGEFVGIAAHGRAEGELGEVEIIGGGAGKIDEGVGAITESTRVGEVEDEVGAGGNFERATCDGEQIAGDPEPESERRSVGEVEAAVEGKGAGGCAAGGERGSGVDGDGAAEGPDATEGGATLHRGMRLRRE